MPTTRRGLAQTLVGCAFVLLVVGCGAESQVSPTPTPSPKQILDSTRKRLGETQSVHFTLAVEGDTFIDSGKNIRLISAEGDVVRPDRVHTTFQAEVLDRAITIQLIAVGEEAWTTNLLTGEWEPAPLEFAYRPDILFSPQDGIGPVMDRLSGVERLQDEEIDGRTVIHLLASVEDDDVGPLTYYTISGSPVSVDLWIDQQTSDLLRARMTEPPGAERPNPAAWTLDLSHHGADVTIEPPAS